MLLIHNKAMFYHSWAKSYCLLAASITKKIAATINEQEISLSLFGYLLIIP